MSKKDRLKAQSEKQLKLKKELEQQEKIEDEVSKKTVSRSAKKLRKQYAKNENVLTMIIRILMILPFAYSGFFYGGVTIVGIATKELFDVPNRIGIVMGAGMLLLVVALFFAFFGKYIIQFILTLVGTGLYLYSGQYIINKISKKIESSYLTDEALKTLDKQYMMYYYPILIMLLLSAILLIIVITKKVAKKRREKVERDNAPVKSIVEGLK